MFGGAVSAVRGDDFPRSPGSRYCLVAERQVHPYVAHSFDVQPKTGFEVNIFGARCERGSSRCFPSHISQQVVRA